MNQPHLTVHARHVIGHFRRKPEVFAGGEAQQLVEMLCAFTYGGERTSVMFAERESYAN